MDQAFPGYRKVFSEVKVKSSLAVLIHFPTPQSILAARKDVIRKVIGEASTRGKNSKFADKKAELLKIVAAEAAKICICRNSFEVLIPMTASLLTSLQDAAELLHGFANV